MTWLMENRRIRNRIWAFPPRSKLYELVIKLEECRLCFSGQVWILFELTETTWLTRRLNKRFGTKYTRFCRPGSKLELGKKSTAGLGLIGLLSNK